MSDEFRNALAADTVLDTYRIERVLGEGGFGVTYLVTELNLGKEYAIKELMPDGVAIRQGGTTVMAKSISMEEDFEATRRHFIKEARVLATLKHPAIVAVHRLFEANGTCYMVMDYVEGETLGTYLKRQRGMLGSRAEFEGIFYPLMDGLELLHGKGMIHRDIKPGNIMVTPDGSPVLLDFGACCRVENDTVTVTQMVSAGYSPFEQYTTRAKQGPYTDIYALGATMVRAITGAKPDDATDRMMGDTYSSLTACSDLVPVYGLELLSALDASVVLKMEGRPQSIEEWKKIIGGNNSRIVRIRRAADEGDASAQWELGQIYSYKDSDYEEAVKWYRKAADQGHAGAQSSLGTLYNIGWGVEEDGEEALKWHRKAADQGYPPSQCDLAWAYRHGEGVEEDVEEALRWYRKAADQGHVGAPYEMAEIYQQMGLALKAAKYYRKAMDADEISILAPLSLGEMYWYGQGIAKDQKEAVKCFRKAADQGFSGAQYELGLKYARGVGVDEDYEEALKWYRKAADQGHADAQTIVNF